MQARRTTSAGASVGDVLRQFLDTVGPPRVQRLDTAVHIARQRASRGFAHAAAVSAVDGGGLERARNATLPVRFSEYALATLWGVWLPVGQTENWSGREGR